MFSERVRPALHNCGFYSAQYSNMRRTQKHRNAMKRVQRDYRDIHFSSDVSGLMRSRRTLASLYRTRKQIKGGPAQLFRGGEAIPVVQGRGCCILTWLTVKHMQGALSDSIYPSMQGNLGPLHMDL